MEIKKEWKVKNIKKYLKLLKNEGVNKTLQLKKILLMLDFLDLEFEIYNSKNGYNIIEVYELYYILETEKRYKLVKF